MRKKDLMKEINNLRKRIVFLEKKTCAHENKKVYHTTNGHWRGNDYVGGDIYSLYCEDCQSIIDHLSKRWGVDFSNKEQEKFIEWKIKYTII